ALEEVAESSLTSRVLLLTLEAPTTHSEERPASNREQKPSDAEPGVPVKNGGKCQLDQIFSVARMLRYARVIPASCCGALLMAALPLRTEFLWRRGAPFYRIGRRIERRWFRRAQATVPPQRSFRADK